MGGQIAQLQLPSDYPTGDSGLWWLFDFPRSKMYYCSHKTIMRYQSVLATQVPEAYSYAWNSTIVGADIDLVSGDLLIHRAPNGSGGIPNGMSIYKFDHTTFALTGTFGAVVSGGPGPWPNSFWGNAVLCCTQSGGVGYCVVQEGVVANPHYGVIRTDTMTNVTTFFQLAPGATGPAPMLACSDGVYLNLPDSTGTGVQFLKLNVASPSWTTLGKLMPAAVDPTCTAVSISLPWGLDATDGNIVAMIGYNVPAGTIQAYAKINPNTGALLWKTPITYPLTAFYGNPAYPPGSIPSETLGLIGDLAYGQINATNGTIPLFSGWLRTSYSMGVLYTTGRTQFQYIPIPGGAMFFGYVGYFNNPGLYTSQPVAGTPDSFQGWAIEQPAITEAPVASGCDPRTETSITAHWGVMGGTVPYFTLEYRLAGSSDPWTVINAGRGVDYTITGLIPETTYTWQVRAADPYDAPPAPPGTGAPSLWSNSVDCTTLAAPAKLTLDNLLVDQVDLTGLGLVYRWRSRQFYLPKPASLGACQVSLGTAVSIPFPNTPALLESGDDLAELPPGVNAMFRLYIGPRGQYLSFTKVLDQPRTIFRLPSGLKAFNWQFEIVARVPIHSVELASTMRELKKV